MTHGNEGGGSGLNPRKFMIEFPDESNLYEGVETLREREGRSSALRTFADETYARSIGRIVANEFRATIMSLRESAAPRTVSHALIYRDGQSTEEIQSRIHAEEADVELVLSALASVNFVKRYEEDGIVRYRIDPPTEFRTDFQG